MDGFAHLSRTGTLFAEDFDKPQAAAEPAATEPVFSASDLDAAREAARLEGRAAGLQEAAASDVAATRKAVAAIAEQFAAEREVTAARAEMSAEAIARLLLDSLAATFPKLCARHGDAEVGAVVRVVLPALTQEPAITVRVHSRTAATVAREIALLDPDLAEHVQTVECDAMPPGDVRIAWRNGAAARDAAALWQQVAVVLLPAGLLRADATIKETIDGD
jgi:flagellar biosynthesis/type III secretory pathway protein FliH